MQKISLNQFNKSPLNATTRTIYTGGLFKKAGEKVIVQLQNNYNSNGLFPDFERLSKNSGSFKMKMTITTK